jgi:hypothetical protein
VFVYYYFSKPLPFLTRDDTITRKRTARTLNCTIVRLHTNKIVDDLKLTRCCTTINTTKSYFAATAARRLSLVRPSWTKLISSGGGSRGRRLCNGGFITGTGGTRRSVFFFLSRLLSNG